MRKGEYKKIIAYVIMVLGVWFLLLGESLVDKEWIMHNHYFVERLVLGGSLMASGAYYWCILDARLNKYGRC